LTARASELIREELETCNNEALLQKFISESLSFGFKVEKKKFFQLKNLVINLLVVQRSP
jgi:ribosomal protein S3AE